MKVGYDNKIFTMQNVGGVSRYFLELASHLNSLNLAETRICAGIHQNFDLRLWENQPNKNFYLDRYFWKKPLTKALNTLSNFVSNSQLDEFSADVIHETYYSEFQKIRNQPCISTVYDCIHELYYPEYPNKIRAKESSMQRASLIIAISENTKKDIIRFYPQFLDKVRVIHLAPSKIFQSVKIESNQVDPYVLFVGSRNGYKNFNSLLLSFSDSNFLKRNFKLHVFGNEPFSIDESKQIRKLNLENSVSFFSGDDSDLLKQYQNAQLFVYPSLYEGFGLPIVEAMASGCPVLSTNAGSLLEVSGVSGYFFDQNSIQDLTIKMEKVLKSEKFRRELIEYGLINSRRFDWGKTAQETLQVYKELLDR